MKRLLKWGSCSIAIPGAVLCFWGFLIGPNRLEETSEIGTIPNLPPEWEGKRVAFISDLQIGMWWNNKGTIKDAIAKLIRERPDITLVGGDFTENPSEDRDQIRDAVEIVSPLARSGLRTFAVLGNHDYSLVEREDPKREAPAKLLIRALEANGIPVLQNHARPVRLQEDGPALYVAGLGSRWAHEDSAKEAMRDVPSGAARIVFMHNPDSFPALPPGSAPLAVCGHTHGGQIRIPGTPQWSWLSIEKPGQAHADGWQPNYGAQGNHLYVNRGLGMSVVPLRINAEPEITWFTLTADAARTRAAGR